MQSKVVVSWDNEEALELLKQSITEKYDFENRFFQRDSYCIVDDELELETPGLRLSDGEDNDIENIMSIDD